MTPTQRAAAERLADDLQRFDGTERESLRDEAADLLRELLAEPVQEPLFWVRLRSDGGYEGPIAHSAIEEVRRQSGAWTPLYAAPQRQPLTDDFVFKVVRSVQPNLAETCRAWKYEFAQCKYWLDAAHGIGEPT